MSEIKQILENYDKPLTKEQLEKIIYNIFCIAIFFAPAIPEIIGFGIYSLRNTIFMFTTVIVALSLIVINRKNIIAKKTNIYDKFLIIYILLVTLSTAFTKFGIWECVLGTNGRGEGLITILCYVATFVIFSRGYSKMKSVSKIAIIAAMIVCMYSFIQANHPSGMKILFAPDTAKGIATGTMRNQNFLSSYICIFLPMSIFYYINGKTKKVISLIIVSLLFATQIYSVTLGGYITFIVMYIIITIYSFIFSDNKKDTIVKVCTLSLILLIIFVSVNYKGEETYTKEISSSKNEVTNLVDKKNDFGNGRLAIWRYTAEIINDNKLLGVGPDSLIKINMEDKYLDNVRVDKAHCEPLHIAVTTGIPSAIIYLIFVGTIGINLLVLAIKLTRKQGIKNDNTIYILMVLICFASYLMQSVINISVVQVAPLFWAIMGTAVGILEENKS